MAANLTARSVRPRAVAIGGGGQNERARHAHRDADIPGAIVGGTGRFAGARGSVTGGEVNDTAMQLTLHNLR
jgi:hypothetical protein